MFLLYMNPHFYFSYFGCKRDEIKYIQSYVEKVINTTKTVVEPFCCSCSFSLKLHCDFKNKKLKYHINDIDPQLTNFLNQVKKDNGIIKFYEYAKKEFNEKEKDKDIRTYFRGMKREDNENPYKYFLYMRTNSIPYHLKDRFNTFFKMYENNEYKCTDHFFCLKNTKITDEDYKVLFDMYKDDENALLFLDPPYFDSYNMEYTLKGKDEKIVFDNTVIFIDIWKLLKDAKCKIICILGKNAVMEHIFKDYIVGEYDKVYQMKKRITKHIIITNIK